MSLNSAKPSHVQAMNRRERRARERHLNLIRSLVEHPEMGKDARAFLVWLMEITKIHHTSMTGNAWTYFNEGARNVGLQVLNDLLEAAPQAYLDALAENKALKKQEASEDEALEASLEPTSEEEDIDG